MNRNTYVGLDPKYLAQQEAIKEACKRLGLVMFLPDYHAAGTDANTVLIYTKAAAEHNLKLDEYEKVSGAYVPAEKYGMHMFEFNNTDANGMFTLDFANNGTIDLRTNMKEAIFQAIAAARKKYIDDSTTPQKYVAVIKRGAKRDVQVCTDAACAPDDDESWVDMEDAEIFIGIFSGSESEALAKSAEYAQMPAENIRLIRV